MEFSFAAADIFTKSTPLHSDETGVTSFGSFGVIGMGRSI